MFKLEEPISWTIKIKPVDAGYLLCYVESYPNDELHMKRIRATKDLVSRLPMFANNVEIEEKDKTIELHFKYIGEKQDIVDMITGEFLAFSRFGKKTFQDLFADTFLDTLNVGLIPGSHELLYDTSDRGD